MPATIMSGMILRTAPSLWKDVRAGTVGKVDHPLHSWDKEESGSVWAKTAVTPESPYPQRRRKCSPFWYRLVDAGRVLVGEIKEFVERAIRSPGY